MSSVATIRTEGHLALQEKTRIHSTKSLQRGEIIRLKAEKPINENPYGYAEVLVVEGNSQYTVRRVS